MEVDRLVADGDVEALRTWLEGAPSVDIAEELGRLEPDDRAVVFRLLPKDEAIEVFETMDAAHQQELLEGLREHRVAELVEEMEPDDRARLLDEMPAKVARRLLAGLSTQERAYTNTLLGYAEESAGRIMSPEVISLTEAMTVGQALAKLRREGADAETVYALPVTDATRRLRGIVSLRDLLVADDAEPVGGIMTDEVLFAHVDDDQEDVARRIQVADLIAMPVVDREDRLVGVVTVDDAMEVLEREQTEDVALAGATLPLDRPYLSASSLALARSRAGWLLILGVAAVLTVTVLDRFEATLEQVTALALFIPLLIDTGGNAGSQAATTVIRAMAVGEVRFVDLLKVVGREVRVGLSLGLMLAAVAFLPVLVFYSDVAGLPVVISTTLLVICTLASLLGGGLPMLARRVGIDPAVVSAPLITTFVDATGLLVYFLIAQAVMGL